MSQEKQRLSLKEAIDDFGWLPLTLLSIGGAISLIDIVELVRDGLTLITPFEVVLKGYRRVPEAIGALVEPYIQPFIEWLSAAFDWELHLQPFWRSLFVLGMVVVLGLARAQWRSGQWGQAILCMIVMGLGALAGAVAAGLSPPSGDWWAQGLVTATPLALLGFVAGAGLSLFLGDGAGLMALGVLIAVLGAIVLVGGLGDAERNGSRVGLSILGGFVAAGMILISNWALLALGVSAAS